MILVVDDHPDTQRAMLMLLKIEGFEAVGVSCGDEALHFFKSHTPCLVLLDYNMPGLNGLEVFQEMKRSPRHADVPVIMFSASSGSVKDEALRAGINSYVVKGSLDWPKLIAEIVKHLGPGACSCGQRRKSLHVPAVTRKVGG
jgi:CheY-like chemotaxis protein